MPLSPEEVMCRAFVASQGKPCGYCAVKDGFCLIHHPKRRINALHRAIETADRRAAEARSALLLYEEGAK